jgi:hypothetical protein
VYDDSGIFLDKAEESLAGAATAFANGRHNNCANRRKLYPASIRDTFERN